MRSIWFSKRLMTVALCKTTEYCLFDIQFKLQMSATKPLLKSSTTKVNQLYPKLSRQGHIANCQALVNISSESETEQQT